jgi:hypothetical protein
MRIPATWQFGALDPHIGRPGEVRRAVAGALLRFLFDGMDPDPAHALLETFAGKLRSLDGKSGAEMSELLVALKLAGPEGRVADRQAAATEAQAPHPGEPGRETLRGSAAEGRNDGNLESNAFCLALHGLCMALAGGTAAARAGGEALEGADESGFHAAADSPGEEENDETPDPAVDPFRDPVLAVEKAAAIEIIARLLPLWCRQKAGERHSQEDVRLLAKVLLECLLEALPREMFVVEEQRIEIEDGEPRTRQRIVVSDVRLTEKIRRLMAELPYRFTLQPLAQPGRYRRATQDSGDERHAGLGAGDGEFEVELIGYRRTNKFLEEFLGRASEACEFREYVRAVNAQQAVAWRINQSLLMWAGRLTGLARPRRRWSDDLRGVVAEAGLDDSAVAAWKKWVLENFYQPDRLGSSRVRYLRPGELLDNPLVQSALFELIRPKNGGGTRPEFYLPWKADYRGRIYAETPWLTPQGGDLQRALFEFANGRPLDEAGLRALRRHGGNLIRRERLLWDLDIQDRQVLTLEERETWVQRHEKEILESARSPLAYPFWREVASKPMQFLAFCLAYREWKEHSERPIHLPVQIDGTCNGLQHIAALTRDVTLAQAVNVVSRSDGTPGDIYAEVAAAARRTVGRIAPLLEPRDRRREPLALADQWLAREGNKLLDRATAKRVVMTVPYGASRGSQARYVLESIAEDIEKKAHAAKESSAILGWLDSGDKNSRIFVRKCTRGLFPALLRRLRLEKSEAARVQLRRVRAFGAFVALAMVVHLRSALEREFQHAKTFSDWLLAIADRCDGLPLMWLTPLGFPVCQDKFARRRASLSVSVGKQRITLGTTRLEENVSGLGQRQALLPNLIHGLDATHLAMTINEAVRRGLHDLGSIHDCLLCHPNDARVLAGIARETFANLYRGTRHSDGVPGALADWVRWMGLVVRIAAVRTPALVLGALDSPRGWGEKWLLDTKQRPGLFTQSEKESTDEDVKKRLADALRAASEAAHDLAVLEDVRRLPEKQYVLATLLLEYAARVPAAGEDRARPVRGEPRRRKHPLSVALPDLEMGTLGEVAMSEYFFS